jgi:hypothetical protein
MGFNADPPGFGAMNPKHMPTPSSYRTLRHQKQRVAVGKDADICFIEIAFAMKLGNKFLDFTPNIYHSKNSRIFLPFSLWPCKNNC